ncbi:MAG TPA: hypothetical protein VM536_12870 [Chloroflexia bacterium]|nr:hypothetical protein [Chloroflexia bacterium]
MKGEPSGAPARDPWRDLASNGALQPVALEEVLARLRVTGRQAGALKQGLLAEVGRLADAGGPNVKRDA